MKRILCTLAVAILFATSAFAKIIRVPADQPTIQAAINAAAKGDTVLVADGTYYENIDFKGKAITVASFYLIDGDTTDVDSTIIDGSRPSDPNKGSVVSFVSGEDTTSVLYGLTVTNGSGTKATIWGTSAMAGGGIYCYNAGCRVLNNKIIHNTVTGASAYGGGFIAAPEQNSKTVILRDNQIEYNSVTASSIQAVGAGLVLACNAIVENNSVSLNKSIATSTGSIAFSGGMDCFTTSTYPHKVFLKHNRINYNSATNNNPNSPGPAAAGGGGISFWGVNGIVSRNEINYNEIWIAGTLPTNGAGIMVSGKTSSLIFEGNIIRGNTTTKGRGVGGGVLVYDASATFVNNIFDGNGATDGGGIAIHTSDSTRIINNTIINNVATSGGGIWTGENANGYAMNTIVWMNQATTGAGIHRNKGKIQAAYSDIQGGWSGVGNLNSDPLFVAGSAQLSDASPCIGAGMDVHDFGGGVILSCPPHDINGRSRPSPAGSRPDMGAWESPGPTAVESQPTTEIPQTYALHQNFPNPFNPSTAIEFALPKASFVTLKIYDLLGKEVATLVAEKLPAGKHQRVWEGKGLASGVYLYRMEAGEFVQTKKLILLR